MTAEPASQHLNISPEIETEISTSGSDNKNDDYFQLYDLHVQVICPPGARILCSAKDGDYFTLQGEMMYLPHGQGISIYSLASILPLLPANQRLLPPYLHANGNDWMASDMEVACPDPECPSRLRITRTGVRTFRRGDVSAGGSKRGSGIGGNANE